MKSYKEFIKENLVEEKEQPRYKIGDTIKYYNIRSKRQKSGKIVDIGYNQHGMVKYYISNGNVIYQGDLDEAKTEIPADMKALHDDLEHLWKLPKRDLKVKADQADRSHSGTSKQDFIDIIMMSKYSKKELAKHDTYY